MTTSRQNPPLPPPLPPVVDLTRPHPKFMSVTRAALYDLITSMYLDSWNDNEVANSLSEQFAKPVDAHVVASIRAEAATAADLQPIDVRRRWIYRYQTITVNNLVKEYMFMEKKKVFIQAKRELAEEIDALVGSTPPGRLCIAVNDALGRNNIGIEHIQDLQAYAQRARKLEAAVRLYANARAMTPTEGLRSVAGEIAHLFQDRCEGNTTQIVQMLPGILGTDRILYTVEDVSFLIEYDRLSGDEGNYSIMMKFLRGADAAPRHSTVLDQILAGTARHLTSDDIQQAVDLIRGRAVLSLSDLEHVRTYTDRHMKDIETFRELGIRRPLTPAAEQAELNALKLLRFLTKNHLTLTEVARFLEESEIRKATKRDISPDDLQIILDRVNGMTGDHEIREFLTAIKNTRKFDFPVDRYLTTRFTLPL